MICKEIKIRVIANWISSQFIHEEIIRQSLPINDGFIFVEDNSYDWLVVINSKCNIDISISKDRVIGFILEPPDHGYCFDKNIGEYCSIVYTCAHPKYYDISGNLELFECGMPYQMKGSMNNYLVDDIEKNSLISMVTSSMNHGFYSYRVALAKQLALTDWCSVYGRGLNCEGVKGELDNKSDGLLPFKFSVCMENGIWDDYVTDKIIDAILCSCVPIYVGAPNIKDYIPFAIELVNYKNPKHAVREIKYIVNHTNYESILPQIKDWKKQYFEKFTVYQKIKNFIYDKQKRLLGG